MQSRKLRLGNWELHHHYLRPTRCLLQQHCGLLLSLHTNPDLVTLTLTADSPPKTLTLPRAILACAGGPLRTLVSGPFAESATSHIAIHESLSVFSHIATFLTRQPLHIPSLPPSLPLVADRWGLDVLYTAWFAHAEERVHLHGPLPALALSDLLHLYLPVMRLIPAPPRFRHLLAQRLAHGLLQADAHFKEHPLPNLAVEPEACCMGHADAVACRRPRPLTSDSPNPPPATTVHRADARPLHTARPRSPAAAASDADQVLAEQPDPPHDPAPLALPHPAISLHRAGGPQAANGDGSSDGEGAADATQEHGHGNDNEGDEEVEISNQDEDESMPDPHVEPPEPQATPKPPELDDDAKHGEVQDPDSSSKCDIEALVQPWHAHLDIWNLFLKQKMMHHVVYYLSRFAAVDQTPLLLDVILCQLESQLSDNEILELLSRIDWDSEQPSVTTLQSPATQRWPARAWRLLSYQQARRAQSGTDVRMLWQCNKLFGEIGARVEEIARRAENTDDDHVSVSSHSASSDDEDEQRGLQFVKEWSTTGGSDGLKFGMRVKCADVRPDHLMPLLLRIWLVEGNTPLDKTNGERAVTSKVRIVASGCGCDLGKPLEHGVTFVSNKRTSDRHEELWDFRGIGIAYRVIEPDALRAFIDSHTWRCGLVFQVRLHVHTSDEAQEEELERVVDEERACVCGLCRCDSCNGGGDEKESEGTTSGDGAS